MDGFNELLGSGMQLLHGFSSAAAVYRRAAREEGEQNLCVAIQVAWGKTEFEEFSERAVMLSTEAEDALIEDSAKLIDLIEQPRPGDVITQGIRRWEVMGMGEEPCFRYDSAGRHFLRIHTRVVKE